MIPTGTGFSFKPQNSGLYQDQQGYFKEFKFEDPEEKLKYPLLDNLDVEKLYYTGNIIEAEKALNNFVRSKLDALEIESMNFERYNKLFRLSQLAMEHYTQQQQVKQQQAQILYEQFQQAQMRCKKLQDIRLQQESKKASLENQLSTLQDKIADIKQETLRIGQYKCIYCNKTFRDKAMLSDHVKRRHEDVLKEIKEYQQTISNSNPISNLKRLEEERKELQEMVHLKQMEQLERIHQKKINEEEMIKQLSDKLETDINQKIEGAFKKNRRLEHEEEQLRRDEEQKQYMNETVAKMNSMFGDFSNQFEQFQEHQKVMSENQFKQQNHLQQITKDQQNFYQENKLEKKKLEQQRVEDEQDYQRMQQKQNELMVQNHMEALTNSVCAEDFQKELKLSEKRQEEQQLAEHKKRQIPIKGDFQEIADPIHIGNLEDDVDSQPEIEMQNNDIQTIKRKKIEAEQKRQQQLELERKDYENQYIKNKLSRDYEDRLRTEQKEKEKAELPKVQRRSQRDIGSSNDIERPSSRNSIASKKNLPNIPRKEYKEDQEKQQQQKSHQSFRKSEQDLKSQSSFNSQQYRKNLAHTNLGEMEDKVTKLLNDDEQFLRESQRWEKENQDKKITSQQAKSQFKQESQLDKQKEDESEHYDDDFE